MKTSKMLMLASVIFFVAGCKNVFSKRHYTPRSTNRLTRRAAINRLRSLCLFVSHFLALTSPGFAYAQAVNLTQNSSGFATEPSISVNANHSWITWLEYDAQQNVDSVHAVRYTNGQEIERVRADAGDSEYLSPQVATKTNGGAWFVWVEIAEEGGVILARERTPTGWSDTPIPVSSLIVSGAFPSVALDDNESPCISWEQSVSWGREVAVACWDGVDFVSTGSPSTSRLAAYEPTLRADAAGGIWAVWQERTNSNYEIMARRLLGGSWGAAVQITQTTDALSGAHLGMHVLPKVAPGNNGNLWIVWISKEIHANKFSGWVSHRRIQLRLVTPSGGLSNIQQVPLDVANHHINIAEKDGGADSPSIAILEGKLFVFYRRLVSGFFRWDLQAQVSPIWTDQWLETPLTFDPDPILDRISGYPAPASLEASAGDVLAVWQADNRTNGYDPSASTVAESDIYFEALSSQGLPVFSKLGEEPREYATPLAYDFDRPTAAKPHIGIPLQMYQGDLHAHSVDSHDGQGGNDHIRENIRRSHDNAKLHFYALTDHGVHLSPPDWHKHQKLRSVYAQAGDMQMLLAVEYTNDNDDAQGYNYGHQNVIFRNARAGLFSRIVYPTPEELWGALPLGDSLAIAHHTGNDAHPYSFDRFDGDYVRLFEVFQERESFECWGCKRVNGDGISIFAGENNNVSPENGGGYFQDTLVHGLRMGIIASPDHHGFKGLAGVYAQSNSREDIFEALHARRTFGVTNYAARLTVDFRADGHLMGEEYSLSDTCPVFYLNASTDYIDGTTGNPATIDEMKLYRVTDSAPGEDGEILKINPGTTEASLVFYDANCPLVGTASYYLRAEQAWDALLPDPLAWSSPVFISWDSNSTSRNAANAAHTIPLHAEVGDVIQATITTTNTGDITWTGIEQYGLTLLGDSPNIFQADSTQLLTPEDFVLYSDSTVWDVELTAPSTPGLYVIRWQMTSPAGEFGTIGSTIVEVTEVGVPPGC